MASEHEKTVAFKRGLENKSAKSPGSLRFADKDERISNGEGKRERARIDAEKKKR